MTGTEPPSTAVETAPPDAAEDVELTAEQVSTPDVAADPAPDPEWSQHENGRWIIGDAGMQAEVVARPPVLARRRPDITIDAARSGSAEYRAVSLRGFSHLESGKPRQDAYVVMATRDQNWLVGCVADGVSAGKFSHRAADKVCDEVVDVLCGALEVHAAQGAAAVLADLPWAQAVAAANLSVREDFQRALNKRRSDAEVPLDQISDADVRAAMSSTAVAFVVATRPDEDGSYRGAVTVAAGDSSALVLREDGWEAITEVKGAGAEVASSAVRPLPRDVTPEPVPIHLRSGDVLAVITDGIGDPMGSGTGVVGRFLAEQWQEPPDPLAFAQQIGFYRKTFTDDRTAVAVWVGAGAP